MTEKKILRFLDEKLLNNSSYAKRRRTDDAGEALATTPDDAKIDLYISALISLWALQCSTGTSRSVYPQPRREYLQTEARKRRLRDQEELELAERHPSLFLHNGDEASSAEDSRFRHAYVQIADQMDIQNTVVRTVESTLRRQSKKLESAITTVVEVGGRVFEVVVRELPPGANRQEGRAGQTSIPTRNAPLGVVAPPTPANASTFATPVNASFGGQAPHSSQSSTHVEAAAPSPALPPALDRNAPPPLYTMDRSLSKVAELWEEWEYGRFGNPPVRQLEEAYGAAWRPEQKERVFFGRRKRIIEEVERLARSYGGAIEPNLRRAIETLDRRVTEGGYSLDRLYKILREEAKATPGRQ